MNTSICNFDREELSQELVGAFAQKPFRVRQMLPWLYRQRVRNFADMSDLPLSLRASLKERFELSRPTRESTQRSKDGTIKFLFGLGSGDSVESVLIRQPDRYTLCISSQVGCAIGCTFCRTAQMGLKRNLTTAEILGQVLAVRDFIYEEEKDENLDFQNIVFMGMGEPLHNVKNVIRAVKLLIDPLAFGLSARRVTVSTSGLVPAIEKFGAEVGQANLAISLNATDDQTRTRIMPINKRWPLEKLLGTLRNYPLLKRQRFTIEYVLLKGVNDREEDLARLPKLLHGIPSKINLIPYNSNSGLGFQPPGRSVIEHWHQTLLAKNFVSTVRWSKGEDIQAACGQLATLTKA